MSKDTIWDQYKETTESAFGYPEIPIGPWTSYNLVNDPRHNLFVLSRYKFCAKMLEGKDLVVEIGCGDGFGIPIMAQAVKQLVCIDWDERNLDNCARRLKHLKNVSYQKVDLNQATASLN
ncbi:MAG TPA: class I SAM-dependent methyltransferase, partial [Chlamydiales bacterium]